MSVSTGDVVAQIFTTTNPTTGAIADADSLPTGVLWVDSVANAATVTIADATGTGRYSFSVTMPTLTAGQRVQVIVAATIAGLACAGAVWEDQASPAVNVTMQQGVAVAAADANGNVPVDVRAWRGEDVQPTAVSGVPDINLAYIDTVAGGMQGIRDANKLAPTAGAPAAGSVDKHLDDILAVAPDNKPTVDANGYAAADLKLWRGFPPNGLSSAGDVLTLVTEIDNSAMQNVADALLLAPSGPAASGSAMDVLADILEDTGTTIPAAIAGIGGLAGSGAISFPITVQDEDSNPIDGVEVWVTTDSAGTNVVAGTLSTDALGLATFMLDAGTYYVWRQKSGYNFTNPVTITVS